MFIEKKTYTLLILFLFARISLQAQSAYDKKLESLYKHSVAQIKSSEVKKKMENGNDIVLLDTRSSEEYSVSHLPGARFIDYKKFTSEDVIQLDKNAEIVVYCTVGYRSERIGEKLLAMGFANVKNLYGGIFQWVNEDRPLINRRNQPTDSVHTYSRSWSTWLQRGIKVY